MLEGGGGPARPLIPVACRVWRRSAADDPLRVATCEPMAEAEVSGGRATAGEDKLKAEQGGSALASVKLTGPFPALPYQAPCQLRSGLGGGPALPRMPLGSAMAQGRSLSAGDPPGAKAAGKPPFASSELPITAGCGLPDRWRESS